MGEPTPDRRAPCVAVVGPANSGKTTFLHQLDRALQHHPENLEVLVLKGSPDGTGRYLFHAPELREELKTRVKGRWEAGTPEAICEAIDHARRHLDLCLLDFGGKHDPANDRMLERCSHFIVLARRFADSAEERTDGAASWTRVCERNGLRPVAVIRSLWQEGEVEVESVPDAPVVEGTFRADAASPDDGLNAPLIDALVERLVDLAGRTPELPYLDLNLRRDWTLEDLPTLGGRAHELDALPIDAPLRLGGNAPTWGYAAAMHRALDRHLDRRVVVHQPTFGGTWIEIPQLLEPDPGSALASALEAGWRESDGWTLLELKIRTHDRWLRPQAIPRAAPLPSAPPPPGPCAVSGAVPIWLHLVYSRWLRSWPQSTEIGVWDARSRSVIRVWRRRTEA